jgi:Ser/Thr protein kinase RdoA (MazF antagonist)
MGVMSTPLTNLDCTSVLKRFLPEARAQTIALGNRGGFSGAQIWRVEGAFPPLCLKAWPRQGADSQQLERMHALMSRARQARLNYVPEVRTCGNGQSWVKSNNRYWDLTTWMPGKADFHEQPTPVRLSAASGALARIHAAWQPDRATIAPCPSIARRLEALADWNALVASGWRLETEKVPVPAWRPLLKRGWQLARAREQQLRLMLAAWQAKAVVLQPCIGDVWHDHILFDGDTVAGVIDYGATRIDHPATDVGRLIGSLVGDDVAGWATAIAAYRSVRVLSWEEDSLARLLDRSGAVIGLLNWLRWCGRGERTFVDVDGVTNHLLVLVARIEKWETN